MSPKVDLKFLNFGWCAPGADLPGKAGEMDQSDVPGTWGRAGGGPHVWPGLPSVWYLRHPVHHDTKAMSLGQWPTWQWVVSTFRVTFSRVFALASNATSNDWQSKHRQNCQNSFTSFMPCAKHLNIDQLYVFMYMVYNLIVFKPDIGNMPYLMFLRAWKPTFSICVLQWMMGPAFHFLT